MVNAASSVATTATCLPAAATARAAMRGEATRTRAVATARQVGTPEAAGMAAGKSIEEMCEKLGKLRTGREPGSVRWVADKLRKKAKGPMLKAYNREKQA